MADKEVRIGRWHIFRSQTARVFYRTWWCFPFCLMVDDDYLWSNGRWKAVTVHILCWHWKWRIGNCE